MKKWVILLGVAMALAGCQTTPDSGNHSVLSGQRDYAQNVSMLQEKLRGKNLVNVSYPEKFLRITPEAAQAIGMTEQQREQAVQRVGNMQGQLSSLMANNMAATLRLNGAVTEWKVPRPIEGKTSDGLILNRVLMPDVKWEQKGLLLELNAGEPELKANKKLGFKFDYQVVAYVNGQWKTLVTQRVYSEMGLENTDFSKPGWEAGLMTIFGNIVQGTILPLMYHQMAQQLQKT